MGAGGCGGRRVPPLIVNSGVGDPGLRSLSVISLSVTLTPEWETPVSGISLYRSSAGARAGVSRLQQTLVTRNLVVTLGDPVVTPGDPRRNPR